MIESHLFLKMYLIYLTVHLLLLSTITNVFHFQNVLSVLANNIHKDTYHITFLQKKLAVQLQQTNYQNWQL